MASVVHARITFTELVNAAFAGANIGLPVDVGLAGIRTVIEKKQLAAIISLREKIAESKHNLLANLLFLYQEQLSILDDVVNAKTPSEAWAAEAHFETDADGSLKCKIGELVETMGDNFPFRNTLVVTQLSREARRAYLKALHCGNTLYFAGPAGTGKTETAKDISTMLGRESSLFNVKNILTVDEVAAALTSIPKDIRTPVIFDEFNRIPTEAQKAILQRIEKERPGQFVILTGNPGYSGGYPVQIPNLQTLKFTIPPLHVLIEAMLAKEGFIKFKALAKSLLACLTDCQTRSSTQPFYDFGLRGIKNIIRHAAGIARGNGYTDEAGAVRQAIGSAYYCRAVKKDKAVVVDAVKRAFGTALALPDNFNGASGHAQQAVAMSHVRHGVCINGVTNPRDMIGKVCSVATTSSPGTKFVTIEIDPKTDITSAKGPLFSIMKDAISESDKVMVFMVMPFGGGSVSAIMEPLNKLFDDNKKVTFDNGEVVRMAPNMNFFVISTDCSTFSPAHISRLGVVTVV